MILEVFSNLNDSVILCELLLGWYVESARLGFTSWTSPSWQLSQINLNCVQVITPWIKPALLPTDRGYKGGRACW